MSTWHALLLMFLVMESPWQAASSANPARQLEPAKDVILVSNNSPDIAKRTRDWTTQMLKIKDRNRLKPNQPHVFVLDRAMLSRLQTYDWTNPSTWFQMEKGQAMSEQDLHVFRMLFAVATLFSILAVVLLWLRFSLIRTMTLVISGLGLVIFALMFLVSLQRGVIVKHDFYVSWLLARKPGAMFGLALAFTWLMAAIIEMIRNGGNLVMRIGRVFFSLSLAVLLALNVFVPDVDPTVSRYGNLPHQNIAVCTVLSGIMLTSLIYATESSKTAWRVGPTLVLLLVAAGIHTVTSVLKIREQLSVRLLAIGEMIYIVLLIFFFALAPFISDNNAPDVDALGKYSSQ